MIYFTFKLRKRDRVTFQLGTKWIYVQETRFCDSVLTIDNNDT